jgi:hypothetical protein
MIWGGLEGGVGGGAGGGCLELGRGRWGGRSQRVSGRGRGWQGHAAAWLPCRRPSLGAALTLTWDARRWEYSSAASSRAWRGRGREGAMERSGGVGGGPGRSGRAPQRAGARAAACPHSQKLAPTQHPSFPSPRRAHVLRPVVGVGHQGVLKCHTPPRGVEVVGAVLGAGGRSGRGSGRLLRLRAAPSRPQPAGTLAFASCLRPLAATARLTISQPPSPAPHLHERLQGVHLGAGDEPLPQRLAGRVDRHRQRHRQPLGRELADRVWHADFGRRLMGLAGGGAAGVRQRERAPGRCLGRGPPAPRPRAGRATPCAAPFRGLPPHRWTP